jgi:hypothetical protein
LNTSTARNRKRILQPPASNTSKIIPLRTESAHK